MLRKLLAVLACLAVVLIIPPAAQADDTTCGVIAAGTHDNVIVPEGAFCLIQGPGTVIKGNVTAFPRSSLLIQGGVEVHGNVIGLADSLVRLHAGLPIENIVRGNVLGDKVDGLELQFVGNVVHGDIHVTGRGVVPLTEADIGVHVCGARLLNGSIEVEKMTISRFIRLDNGYCSAPNFLDKGGIKVVENHVPPGVEGLWIGQAQIASGNLQVFKNTGGGPKTVVGNNVATGEIQCYENDPPFVGGPNMGKAPKSVPVFMMPLTTAPNQCSGTSM